MLRPKPLLAPAPVQGNAPVDFLRVGGAVAERRPELNLGEPGVRLPEARGIAVHAPIRRDDLPDIEPCGGEAGAPARRPIGEDNGGAASHPVSYTHLRAHETRPDLVCRLLLE